MPTLFSVEAGSKEQIEVVLRRPRRHGVVVNDSSGVPVAGARILVEASDWGWPVDGKEAYFDLGTTGMGGQLPVLVGSPQCRALIAAEGYSLFPFNLGDLAGALNSVIYTLPDCSEVSGVVFGAQYEGRVVVAAELVSSIEQPLTTVPVGPSSDFVHAALSNGLEWALTPCVESATGLQPIGPPVIVVPPVADVYLSAEEGLSLTLAAVDSVGNPIAADVAISLLSSTFLAQASYAQAEVDSEGTVYWPSLPCPSAYLGASANQELWVCAEGFVPLSVGRHDLIPGNTVDLGVVTLLESRIWNVRAVGASDHAPIGKAKIQFIPSKGYLNGLEASPWLQNVLTDSEGFGRLIRPNEAGGFLVVSADGWLEKRIELAEGDCVDIKVELERPSGLLLACESMDGALLPSVAIQWRSKPGLTDEFGAWQNERAGSDGYARFDVVSGDLEVRHAPGSLSGVSPGGAQISINLHGEGEGDPRHAEPVLVAGIAPGELRSVTLRLGAMSEFIVDVFLDGEPSGGDRIVGIPGFDFDVVSNEIWGTYGLPRGITDAMGRCSLIGLPLGNILIARIDPATQFVTYMQLNVARSMDEAVPFRIETREISVTLVDSDGRPLGGVELSLDQLTLQHGVMVPSIMQVSPSGRQHLATAPKRSLSAVTDSFGKAAFKKIPHEARFRVSCKGSETHARVRALRVDLGREDVNVRLVAGSGAAIEVELQDSRGLPQRNELVVLVWRDPYDREQRLIRETDGDGFIRFFGLDPGSYTLRSNFMSPLEVEVSAGELRTIPLTVH